MVDNQWIYIWSIPAKLISNGYFLHTSPLRRSLRCIIMHCLQQHTFSGSWHAVKWMWDSVWNAREHVACAKFGLDVDDLGIAVPSQKVIDAEYAYVAQVVTHREEPRDERRKPIFGPTRNRNRAWDPRNNASGALPLNYHIHHSTNPSAHYYSSYKQTLDNGITEIYADVEIDLGETLGSNAKVRQSSWRCKRQKTSKSSIPLYSYIPKILQRQRLHRDDWSMTVSLEQGCMTQHPWQQHHHLDIYCTEELMSCDTICELIVLGIAKLGVDDVYLCPMRFPKTKWTWPSVASMGTDGTMLDYIWTILSLEGKREVKLTRMDVRCRNGEIHCVTSKAQINVWVSTSVRTLPHTLHNA